MDKTLYIDNKTLEYTIKKSKASNSIRLTIYHDGKLVVTVPQRVSFTTDTLFVERFITSKSDWIFDKLENFKNNPKKVLPKHTAKEIKEYKNKANEMVLEKLEYWNYFYNFSWNKVTIKNIKSRWGSCSKKGNLNFNYKIALLPPHLVDYIIVHELCHLGELNHSENFWNLVSKTVPNHKNIRSQLKNIV